MKKITVFLIMMFAAVSCTPEKEDSFYEYPDSVSVADKDNNYVNDTVAGNDNSALPDDDKKDTIPLPDNNDVPDDEVSDEEIVNDDPVSDNETTDDPLIATCGNGQVDYGEVCEKGDVLNCTDLDPQSYSGGEASCNDSCSAWDLTDCSALSCETAVDNPDDSFTDTNCDGIDGDASASVFVDKVDGNNMNPGTMDKPVATINKGIEIAVAEGKKHLLIATGAYSEQVVLVDGISIHGAYSGYPKWARGVEFEVQIIGSNPVLIGESLNNTTINYLSVRAGNNFEESGSSTAVFLKDSSMIYFNNVDIRSGHGGDGLDGQSGEKGSYGEKGGEGTKGCEDGGLTCSSCSRPPGGSGGSSPCGMTGGKGGDAGHDSSSGSTGAPGVGGSGDGGNAGTSPYSGDLCPDTNIAGKHGNDGSIGEHGVAGKSFGGYDEFGYITGDGGDGSQGTHGHGGGGGGGGAGGSSFCASYGSSGGGGGGGGCGGTGGKGGKGGGGSFGIWADNCTDIILRGVIITTSDGGEGGNGGGGGQGGIQGFGGLAGPYGGSGSQDDAGCGGNGGNGGAGGKGGSGGGGGGGPSIGIVSIKSTFDGIMHSTFLIGNGGAGGKGDFQDGYAGKKGVVMEF